MTTPYEDSILISATIGDLTTATIGMPSDGNFGGSPSQHPPGGTYPNADAPIQIIPGINSNTTAPDVIDAIISYLQKNSSLNLTRPVEDLTLSMSNIYQARQANTGTLVNVIPYDHSNLQPDLQPTNLITPINISVNGGDIIRCKINGTFYSGLAPLPSYYPQQINLINEDTSNSDNYLYINIKDPYRNSVVGTSYILTIAEVYIKNTATVIGLVNAVGLNSFQIQIIPSPSMGITPRLSNQLDFYVDQDIVITPFPSVNINAGFGITSPNPSYPGNLLYVSGIPTITAGYSINIDYEVDSVVNNFYNGDYVGQLYPFGPSTNFDPVFNPSILITTGVQVLSNTITMKDESNANFDNFIVTIVAEANTSNGKISQIQYVRKIYYDTKSFNVNNPLLIRENQNADIDFHARIKSKVGLFPTYSNAELSYSNISSLKFDSSLVLDNTTKLDGTGYELQLQDGYYKYPGDCSVSPYSNSVTIYPIRHDLTQSFSYAGLAGDPVTVVYRWATFIINGNDITQPFIKDKNSITMTFNNAVNFSGSATAAAGVPLVSNLFVFIKFVDIVGSTGVPSINCGYSQNGIFTSTPNGSNWFDCNKEGNLATPMVDGDGIVDGSYVNTLTSKKLSFGTRSYTGRLLVRVGTNIVPNPKIKFSGVSFS